MDHSLSPFGSVYALIVKVKNNVFVRMIIKSLSQFYRMNEQRLGIELPIGSRGMGGTKISQQEITKFMAKIMRDQERN